MALTKEEVAGLAKLARLELNPEEMEKRSQELDRILEYVARLADVDTKDIPETEGLGQAQPLRVDEPVLEEAATRNLIVGNFPDKTGDALRVPAVFENPKG
jgi:aspartyl-tRNA(Asn)/glutamyl-tRNA(Gln) amidotransferase subunit C